LANVEEGIGFLKITLKMRLMVDIFNERYVTW
jgi:hypothetical protein